MQNPAAITLKSPEETTDLAKNLGAVLQPGDVLLLEGAIGSGKTHFARSLIRSLMRKPEDVPSPTFTLVQVYETVIGEIWHSDLYRLSDISEIEELGLTDAFETAVCLVEWPEKLGPLTPPSALTFGCRTDLGVEDTRHLQLRWSDPKWQNRLEGLR